MAAIITLAAPVCAEFRFKCSFDNDAACDGASHAGDAYITGSGLRLTTNANSQTGYYLIDIPASVEGLEDLGAATALQLSFRLYIQVYGETRIRICAWL